MNDNEQSYLMKIARQALRAEIAKAALAALLSNPSKDIIDCGLGDLANDAVTAADSLIARLEETIP